MRVMFICIGLLLAGCVWSQAIDLPAAASAPEVTIDIPRPAPELWPDLLVVADNADDDAKIVRYIPINHLDIRALSLALGGSYIDLRPLYFGNGGQGPARQGQNGGLDRNAPLSPFVPPGVRDILGLQR